MQTLRIGSKGHDVEVWQNWLRGRDFPASIDGVYGAETARLTKLWQAAVNLPNDGIVGNASWGKALVDGLSLADDSADAYDPNDKRSPAWPPRPGGAPIGQAQREIFFGKFKHVPAPTDRDKEAIRITDGWTQKNIVMVKVPQLAQVKIRGPKDGMVPFHKAVAHQLQRAFYEIEKEGLLSRIVSYDGTLSQRYIRGRIGSLSSHSWGTAIDLNAEHNGLQKRPALMGALGCLREIVPIMHRNGFWWYGWPPSGSRVDGMHFEIFKILPVTAIPDDLDLV